MNIKISHLVSKKMSVLSKISVIEAWKNADCVCFDVDSTVCRNEAIDDLANFVNVGAQVEKMYEIRSSLLIIKVNYQVD